MKKIAVVIVTIIFIFTFVNLCMAANEFETKGVVTNIKGNEITIKTDKGKTMTFESDMSGIKTGDSILILGKILRPFTRQDKEFLTNECHIAQEDIDIIPKLSKDVQFNISNWVAAKDCKKLVPFANSRDNCRQLKPLKPGDPLPKMKPGWSYLYVTEDEWKHYYEILEKAPL